MTFMRLIMASWSLDGLFGRLLWTASLDGFFGLTADLTFRNEASVPRRCEQV